MATRIEKRTEFKAAVIAPRAVGRVHTVLRRTVLRPLPCSIFAGLGIFGGLASLLVGIVSIIIHAVVPNDQLFDRFGTALLVVAIPLILVGSIFLDEINNCR